ncbi:importin-4-like isoform X2 [Drosophila subpulchrella]|nr:importin-4-like isoform X2 [Drosophila subpulchrella]
MEAAMLELINGLLATDTERIRQSTDQLMKAYENPDTLLCLAQIVTSNNETQVRQFAAVLLRKRLNKLRHWQMLSAEHQAAIKSTMLQVLITEKERSVKNAVAQLIGALVRHEAEKGESWMTELLNFVYERCSSSDPKESELGATIFSTLTDSAPDQFALHMEAIFQLFAGVLVAAEASGDLATPTVYEMLVGTCYLLPFISGHSAAEQTVVKAMPLILKALHAFAQKGDEQKFMGAFDIVDHMAEYVPHLLNTNVKPLLEFSLVIAGDKQLEDPIRCQVISFIAVLGRIKKKPILKQKLLEPILSVLFEVMCQHECEDADEDYFTEESEGKPASAAVHALDQMALNMSPEKFIPPMLQLLEPALQNPDPAYRRSSFMCMGVIAEGCSEAIINKYLEVMLNIIKAGIADSVSLVRASAFFALGQFSEHLQPDISKFAPQILPVLFAYLSQLILELKVGEPDRKHMDRMFYALTTFCENLEDELVPHLPTLMDRLFKILEPQHPISVREKALEALASVSDAAKAHMMPYFPTIMSILQPFLVKDCPEEGKGLRIEAIETLAALSRNVGKDNFMPLADDTMNFCLLMLADGPDDPDVRRVIYRLIGSLSTVVNDSMATVFPKIMDRVMESVISTEDMMPCVSDKDEMDPVLEAANVDIDLENTDDEDDSEDLLAYQTENDYVGEKEEAIYALKEFAENTGSAFVPYLQPAFENVYTVIDHPQEEIRRASITAICGFMLALDKMSDADGLARASGIVIPKLAKLLRSDDEVAVAIHLMEQLSDLMREAKLPVITKQEHVDDICAAIKDVFANKLACQFNEQSGGGDEEDAEDSEFDEMLIETAFNLVPTLKNSVAPEAFSMFFGRIYQFFVQKLAKAKKQDMPEHRAFIYGALADCFIALGGCTAMYFDALCPLFIAGTKDSDPKTRQNCYFGLGEMVFHAEQKSFESYPAILQALSEAISRESNPPALDNICGAVARLICTNHEAVPLGQVLPVFLNHLPLKEDFEENDMVQKAFRVLYMNDLPSIEPHVEQMLIITIDSVFKKQVASDEATESAVTFIKEIRTHYPDIFNKVANTNPEVFNYVQAL